MKFKVRKKVLDMRTERGSRVLEDMNQSYNMVTLDKDIIFSYGFTHVIKNNGEILVVFKGEYIEI